MKCCSTEMNYIGIIEGMMYEPYKVYQCRKCEECIREKVKWKKGK